MSWAKPTATKSALYRAGRVISSADASADATDAALSLISYWRLCHALPMVMVGAAVKIDSYSVSPGSLVTQRLKRMASIRQLCMLMSWTIWSEQIRIILRQRERATMRFWCLLTISFPYGRDIPAISQTLQCSDVTPLARASVHMRCNRGVDRISVPCRHQSQQNVNVRERASQGQRSRRDPFRQPA